MPKPRRDPRTPLERIIDERAAVSMVGTVHVAIDKITDEIAREALADPDLRRLLHELVSRRARALLAELLGAPNDAP